MALEQQSIFDQPSPPLATEAHARSSDPWTSHAAARSIPEDKLRESQRAVLDCFRRFGPMHLDLLIERYGFGQSPSGLRTRTSELVKAGYLRDSGDTVVLPSGRKAIVWEVAE